MELIESKSELKKAIFLRQNKQYDEALNIIQNLEKEFSYSYSILFEKAIILKKIKKYHEAITILEKLKYTEKRNIVLNELGSIYYNLGKFYKAVDCYEDLLSESIYVDAKTAYYDKTSALHHMSDCFRLLGLYSNAENCLQKLLNLTLTDIYSKDKDKLFVYSKLGNLYLEQGKVSEALTILNKALKNSNSKYNSIIKLQIAGIYLNNHQVYEAQTFLKSILESQANKNNIILNANYLLAKSFIMLNDFSKAQTSLQTLVNTIYHKKAIEELIFINFKLGNYEQVINYIQLNPSILKNNDIKEIYSNIKNNLKEYNSYNEEDIISKIQERNYLNKPAREVFKEITLSLENYYDSDLYDNYYLTIPQIGMVKEEPTDFLKVKTLVNSHKIVDIIPCKSLNNELKCQTEEITLQKKP